MLTLLLTSCVMTKTYTNEEKKMKLENETFLLIKNDGQKISGQSLKLLPKSLIKIDDQEFKVIDVSAYQNKTAYFVKFGTPENYVWTKQLKRGKINLYYYDVVTRKSYYNGSKYVNDDKTDTHFVFSKNGEQLQELSITDIAERLKDNVNAFNKFKATFGEKDKKIFGRALQNHPKVLFESIDIYNGNL